jgi:hypothetical protein
MQKKYAAQGLIVVTVSLDPAREKARVDEANAFLREQNSPFVNLLLDEPSEIWSKRLGFIAPPCYFIFDRQGKWIRLSGVDFDPDELKKEKAKVIDKMMMEK